jgi:PHD/YefM family antitoxin component YafN of YafNO toxin-antitoxin module
MVTAKIESAPLEEFTSNSDTFQRRLRETGAPIALTVDGRPECVVLGAGAYEKLVEGLDATETLAGIRRGLDSLSRGEGIELECAYAEMDAKHQLSERLPAGE